MLECTGTGVIGRKARRPEWSAKGPKLGGQALGGSLGNRGSPLKTSLRHPEYRKYSRIANSPPSVVIYQKEKNNVTYW